MPKYPLSPVNRRLATKWLMQSLSTIMEIHLFGGGKSPKGMRFSQLMDNNKQARQKQMVIQSPLHNVFNRCSLNIKSRFSFS